MPAVLSSNGKYTLFSSGERTIKFRTSEKLVKYTDVRKWDNGYLEVGADYGNGVEEEYIDLSPILRNLFIDEHTFLDSVKQVEVKYG